MTEVSYGWESWRFHNQSDDLIKGTADMKSEYDFKALECGYCSCTEENHCPHAKDFTIEGLPLEEEDKVNNPSHYNDGTIECIEYLQDNMPYEAFVGYLEGNVKKYMHRWRYKNGVEDLKKAGWYLSYLIDTIELEDN